MIMRKKLWLNTNQIVKYFKITRFIFIPLFTIVCFVALDTSFALLLTFIYVLNNIVLYKDFIERKNTTNFNSKIRRFKIAHFILVPIGIIVLFISLKFHEAIILIGILTTDSLFAYIDLISQKQIKNS